MHVSTCGGSQVHSFHLCHQVNFACARASRNEHCKKQEGPTHSLGAWATHPCLNLNHGHLNISREPSPHPRHFGLRSGSQGQSSSVTIIGKLHLLLSSKPIVTKYSVQMRYATSRTDPTASTDLPTNDGLCSNGRANEEETNKGRL